MPAIICRYHGRQLCSLACPHIANRFEEQCYPSDIFPVRGTYVDPAESMTLFWCCAECWAKLGLSSHEENLNYEDIPESLALMPLCSRCFEAWRLAPPGK
jgi:hypothetical protein